MALFDRACSAVGVRLQSYIHRAWHDAGTGEVVTGFGCRPYTDVDAGETGPAFESRQGRRARVWGSRISGLYGDLAGAMGVAGTLWVRSAAPDDPCGRSKGESGIDTSPVDCRAS
jgi:hypothetical protein